MKKIFSFIIISILSVCICKLYADETTNRYTLDTDTLVVYKDVPGQIASDKYSIRVRMDKISQSPIINISGLLISGVIAMEILN